MKKDEAQRQIVAEMHRRLPEVPYKDPTGGLKQYNELRQQRPDLFTWASSGDPWQDVQALLSRHRLTRN